jgi:hypothetical protein
MRCASLWLLLGCGNPATVADAPPPQYDADPMWTTLFDGTPNAAWRMSTIVNQPPPRDDPGRFELVDGALLAIPGNDIGLYWYTTTIPADFELALEWKQASPDDNSGIFVRFPDLDSKGYNNTAYVAVDFGFEIQIDNNGFPDGAPKHTTGAIYNQDDQAFTRVPAKPVGDWNDYRIRAQGQLYTVTLNGTQTTRFTNLDPARGAGTFIGLQTHPAPGSISYRNIRVRAL